MFVQVHYLLGLGTRLVWADSFRSEQRQEQTCFHIVARGDREVIQDKCHSLCWGLPSLQGLWELWFGVAHSPIGAVSSPPSATHVSRLETCITGAFTQHEIGDEMQLSILPFDAVSPPVSVHLLRRRLCPANL